jgi:sulfoxide reductase catalytic subunit YedY
MTACLLLLVAVAICAPAGDRTKVDRSMYDQIIHMDPKDVDPSGLPLTSVASLHSTGTPQNVDVTAWRLTVSGPGVKSPLSLSYAELEKMQKVKKAVLLICPEFFYDYLEWEGVSVSALLEKAGVSEYSKVSFTSVDDYTSTFTRREIETHLIMVATKNNGVPLPRAHGFPARVVAEDIFGGRWVKYLKEISVE